MASVEELKQRMTKAVEIEDMLDRRLFTLAVVTQHLSDLGIKPVLVGGGAVQLYTLGGYTTKDLDVIMPSSPRVDQAMAELDFEKQGRYWVRDDIDIAIEAPSSLLTGELDRVTEVRVDDMSIYVIGIEDLIIDRLNAYVHWKSIEDGRWASRLIALGRESLDWEYLTQRAGQEKVSDALIKLSESGEQ
ncbi:MAG: DUF6036 family nucleotidyltransferase [Armatimonadota bacterium]